MRSFLPFLLLTLTACTDKSNTDTGSDSNSNNGNFTVTLSMHAPDNADTDITFTLNGEPVEPEVEVNTENGFTYQVGLDWDGYLAIVHDVYLEPDDAGETLEVNWNDEIEGSYGVDFAKWCTADYDGSSVFIETFIGEDGNGEDAIIIDGLPGRPFVTDRDFSGEDGGDTFAGGINDNGTEVHFLQYTPDGELWKERDYTNCHE